MVSTLSMAFMVIGMLLGIGVPIALALFFHRKYGTSLVCFIIGCGTMFIFAQVLEQIVHMIVLGSPVGPFIENSILAIAIYGSLMAGLFEEVGRFVAMRFVLKKRHGDAHYALMYGVGHGGYEMVVFLALGMFNNLIYSILINMGKVNELLAPLDGTMKATAQASFDALIQTPSWHFCISPVERMAAMTAQLALSVIVWFAATGAEAKVKYLILAIVLHAILDGVAVFMARMGVPLLLVEAMVWIIALGIAVVARKLWEKNREETSGDYSLSSRRT